MNPDEAKKMLEERFKPLEVIIPRNRRLEIKRKLKNTDIDPDRYIRISIGISITISLLLIGLLLTQSPVKAAGIGLISFSSLYYLVTKIPVIVKRKYNNSLDRSMARALRTISTELKIGTPLHRSIQHAASQDNPGGKELKKVNKDLKKGSSFPEALAKMSRRNTSKFIKRTASQMTSIHSTDPEKGSKALKKLAREQESILRNKMKEYNEKLLVYSLLFIAASAVIPAMFQALVIIGSNFLNLNISPTQALLIPAVGFPALNLLILGYTATKKP